MKLTKMLIAGWLALMPCTVMAQNEVRDREVKGPPGRDIRIGVYANLRPDCSSGPLPTIRLDQPPTNGSVTVKRGKIQVTSQRQNCLAAEVPGFVAFYRAKNGFTGSDEVVLEIDNQAGKKVKQKIKITVEDNKAKNI